MPTACTPDPLHRNRLLSGLSHWVCGGVFAFAQQLSVLSAQHSYFLELECRGNNLKEPRASHLDTGNTAGGPTGWKDVALILAKPMIKVT